MPTAQTLTTALRHAIAWLGVAGLAACAAALQIAIV